MISYSVFETIYPNVDCFFGHIIKKVNEPKDMSAFERLKIDGFDMNFKHLYDCFFGAEIGG